MPLGELSICDASVVMFAALKDQPAEYPKNSNFIFRFAIYEGQYNPSNKS